jgi:hypothetical protein
MNADIQLEHRAGSSQGKHEGEPSLGLCDRLNLTRDNSQRQLPTDHDYAVPTREYQTDQSSLKTAPTAARSVFGKRRKQRQRQKQPHWRAELTRSLHISGGWKCDLAITLQPFKYLTELQRHSPSLSRLPASLKAQVF